MSGPGSARIRAIGQATGRPLRAAGPRKPGGPVARPRHGSAGNVAGAGLGGPIGLDWATRRPDRVRALVILNSWAWSVRGDPHFEAFSRIMGGPLGRLLIRRFNVFVRLLMPVMSLGRIPPDSLRYHRDALRSPSERTACAQFPGAVIGASEWLEELELQLSRLQNKPVLMLWGMRDIAFRRRELRRWLDHFPKARAVRFPRSGHFLQEEKPEAASREVREFLDEVSIVPSGTRTYQEASDAPGKFHSERTWRR